MFINDCGVSNTLKQTGRFDLSMSYSCFQIKHAIQEKAIEGKVQRLAKVLLHLKCNILPFFYHKPFIYSSLFGHLFWATKYWSNCPVHWPFSHHLTWIPAPFLSFSYKIYINSQGINCTIKYKHGKKSTESLKTI